MRILLALPVLFLVGCIGPAASLTTHGAIVGADDSAAAFLGSTGTATTFLAVPRDLSDLESNIVDDADLVTIEQAGASVVLANEGGGIYSSNVGVAYVPDATYNLTAVVDGESHVVSLEAPEGPDVVFTEGHLAGSPLTVDLAGQGFDHALAFVVDQTGAITWDNRPASDAELVEDLRDANGVDNVQIPNTAFPVGGGVYIVAVGGFVKAKGTDYHGFGALLSTFAAGKFTGAGLSVR
jgi:hypothetical protein